jgi:hypothetical protein
VNLKNLLIQVLDGLVGKTSLPTNLRASFLFLLIWRHNNLLGPCLIVNYTQFKTKVGIAMVLRKVFKRMTMILSYSMRKRLENDVLGDIFNIICVKQHIFKSIILSV